MTDLIRDFRVEFARGGGKAKGGGIGDVVAAVVGAAAGSGGCGTGTVAGKKGFQKGNHCHGKAGAPSPVAVASRAHQSARRSVNSHIKAGTLNSKAGRASVKAAAGHARALHEAKGAAKAAKAGAAKATRAVAGGRASALPTPGAKPAKPATRPIDGPADHAAKAEYLADAAARKAAFDAAYKEGGAHLQPLSRREPAEPTAMEARVAASVKSAASMKAERATRHLHDLHAKAKEGTAKGDDIRERVDAIARGTTKAELFDAAKAAGIDHEATTKVALVAHLKAHATGHMKPGVAKHEATKASAPMSSKDFADKVVKAAHASPTGGFGGEKTFINHAKAHLDATDPAFKGMGDADFKAKLLQANREGHLELGRGDLTPSMNPADVKASGTPHMGVEYHFVRHPEKAAAAKHPAREHIDKLMAATGAKSHEELAGHLKALAGDKELLKAAGVKLAPKAAAPKAAKGPRPANAVPAPGPGVPDAVRHLRELQGGSTGYSPSEIDARVREISHLSRDDLKHVQREFLGLSTGASKKAAMEAIARKIHNFRASADRVQGIRER